MSNSTTLDDIHISSFAAPTAQDLAVFDSLSPAQQRALVEREIEKGFQGEPVALTETLSDELFQQAMKRAAEGYAPR
jgi:hypothetical protein